MDIVFLVLGALLIAIAALLVRAIVRRAPGPQLSRVTADISLAAAWDEWLQAPGQSDAERSRRNALFALVTPAHREAVRDDLLRFERRALAQDEPLLAIRAELMDSIDRRMLNREILALPENLKRRLREQSGDVIASDEDAENYLAANELRLEVLREYGARRYGDRAADDWFEVYQRASALKQRTARNFIARSASGGLDEEQDARQQAISLVDSQLRAHLLKVAPGTRFERLPERGDA